MARIRSVKPGFFLNEDVAGLSYPWRLLFIGLWTQADRNGRLEDRPLRLKAALFPYDDLDINDGLGCLANARLITRYERNGAKFIAIPTWERHQQPHVREVSSVIPAPDKHGARTRQARVQPVRSGSGSRSGSGKGADPDPDQGAVLVPALRAAFERFWDSYPRKVGKDAAWIVWQRRKPDDALTAFMITAVREQIDSVQWQRDGGQFIPHPRTWLSQGRWQDGPEPEVHGRDPFDGLRKAVESG